MNNSQVHSINPREGPPGPPPPPTQETAEVNGSKGTIQEHGESVIGEIANSHTFISNFILKSVR